MQERLPRNLALTDVKIFNNVQRFLPMVGMTNQFIQRWPKATDCNIHLIFVLFMMTS